MNNTKSGETAVPSIRILVTASTFPVRIDDGSPRFVYDLAEALSAHASVAVLAPRTQGAPPLEKMGAVDVFRFRYFWPSRWQFLTPGEGRGMRERMREHPWAKVQVAPFLLAQAWATRRLIRRLSVDVINAHWLVPQGLTAAWAVTGRDRPMIVLHVHAGDVYLLQKLPLGRKVARYVVSRCGLVFADGSHVRDSLDELLGYPSSAILQPMGVHHSAFAANTGESETIKMLQVQYPGGFLVSVGRLVEKKGTIYLIRAMRDVLKNVPDMGLILIGDGPEKPKLEREADNLGLSGNIQFLGKLPQSEITQYLQSCRIAVVPSIIDSRGETDGMPTVVLEAMAAGVAVVGSAVDGIPDVIRDGENGWLCREKDPVDLADKIIAALNSDSACSLAENALRTSENYDWQAIAQNYMSRIKMQFQM